MANKKGKNTDTQSEYVKFVALWLIDSVQFRRIFKATYKNWETAKRLTCLYEVFSENLRLKKDMNKRKFFCFNATSDTLHEDLRTLYFSCDMNIHTSIVVQFYEILCSRLCCVAQQHAHNAMVMRTPHNSTFYLRFVLSL